ncbi:MAG: hypothetical protein ACTSU4_11275 [Promethearchaeota archaeon]
MPRAQIRTLFYLLNEHQKYIPIKIWRRKKRLIMGRYKKDYLEIFSQIEQLHRRIKEYEP